MDQLTKFLALQFLTDRLTLPILPGIFHLTLVHNTGIAFGFFRNHSSLLLVFISLSLVFLLFWGFQIGRLPSGQRCGLALILGGALGNWIDRIPIGAVIDFLDFRIWPVFNVADSAITMGVIIYFVLLLRSPR